MNCIRLRLRYDIGERALWTGLEGAVGFATVYFAELPPLLGVPIAVVAAIIKGWIAGRVGRLETASTLPPCKDPICKAHRKPPCDR